MRSHRHMNAMLTAALLAQSVPTGEHYPPIKQVVLRSGRKLTKAEKKAAKRAKRKQLGKKEGDK